MDHLWTRCNNCRRILYKQDIIDNNLVCPSCNFHFRLTAAERLNLFFDEGKYTLIDQDISPEDPLQFVDNKKYSERLEENRKKTSLQDAVLNARGKMGGLDVVIAALDFNFMGGSMGSVVGEKITRAAELALKEAPAFNRRFLFWRSEDAGGRVFFNAAHENQLCDCPLG